MGQFSVKNPAPEGQFSVELNKPGLSTKIIVEICEKTLPSLNFILLQTPFCH